MTRLTLLLAVVPLFLTSPLTTAADAKIDYSRDIRPILANHCWSCHGSDEKTREAGLRLDTRDGALAPRKQRKPAVVAGDPAASTLIARIEAAKPSKRMPPAEANKPLNDRQKQLLRRWIEQGADYTQHWAFVPPRRPPVPGHPRERVIRNSQVNIRNPIDAFVHAKRQAAKLEPSPEADKCTLIRRVTFDLTGLPPTLAELDAFLADTSPDAYEKVVERLLASPRYGEKMANLWLDLARFGDTSGYEYDSTRQMWMWRDWVINAYNRNLPFDQFTIQQLAGDLLPRPTRENKIASGFNRNTRFNEEAGSDPEEFVVRYNVDRTATLGQVWLGLTLGCAECHSHKYDPISQKEFYQLYAFFTGIKEPMLSGNHDQPLPPLLQMPLPGQETALTTVNKELAELRARILAELKKVQYVEPATPAKEPHLLSQKAWEERAKADNKLPADVQAALKVAADKRNDAQKTALRNHFVRFVFSGTRGVFDPLNKKNDELTARQKKIEASIPYTLISEEMEKLRPAHVLIRGDFQQRGEKVERDVPGIFPPLPGRALKNRLGLALWLVSPDHPLTARVAVNRLWAQLFGTGLVKTIGDFGTQGELPSHPDLLDWLATEFIASGWDTKAMLKTMALSATYRQSSALPLKVPVLDPNNRLLYRAPRFRHSAEEVRDNALAVAGLLSNRIGGPSVMPYQPPDFYKGKYEKWQWVVSQGDDFYRRGMYTFWRRTCLHPVFALFDAPSREDCTVWRARTNTPLQALVTLNDPTFVEAARVFARRVLTEGPADLEGRIGFAFRVALARKPDEREVQVIKARYQRLLERYRKDPKAATEVVKAVKNPRGEKLDVAEYAAWTGMANLILNLDETLTRE
ncbi:MAG: PSD1 domain-containing protein [Planctomycetes bacterium]|nr:PSD1 domain-containing protein [Planctomycetota bacterium]